ncbi:unnamed protein product, partial [Nesidiocoris tenuis]
MNNKPQSKNLERFCIKHGNEKNFYFCVFQLHRWPGSQTKWSAPFWARRSISCVIFTPTPATIRRGIAKSAKSTNT